MTLELIQNLTLDIELKNVRKILAQQNFSSSQFMCCQLHTKPTQVGNNSEEKHKKTVIGIGKDTKEVTSMLDNVA